MLLTYVFDGKRIQITKNESNIIEIRYSTGGGANLSYAPNRKKTDFMDTPFKEFGNPAVPGKGLVFDADTGTLYDEADVPDEKTLENVFKYNREVLMKKEEKCIELAEKDSPNSEVAMLLDRTNTSFPSFLIRVPDARNYLEQNYTSIQPTNFS